MKRTERPIFKSGENKNWFAIIPILPQIIISAIVFYIYYYLLQHDFFPLWITYIYLAAKIMIVLQIIIAATRSLWGPIITIALGVFNLYELNATGLAWLSSEDAWQLIGIGAFSFLITIVVKVLK